jgi:redox-sensing transcriptional repressor
VALFDNDPKKIGQSYSGLVVQGLDDLAIAANTSRLGLSILCVPAEAAQRVADQIVACGIQGILNFAPVPIVVPSTVSVMAVDLSVQLELLAYKVQNQTGGISYAG